MSQVNAGAGFVYVPSFSEVNQRPQTQAPIPTEQTFLPEPKLVEPPPEPVIKPEPVVTPTPPRYQTSELKADGLKACSWGDPHFVSGDGRKWDNMLLADIVLARSKAGDLEIQSRQEKVAGQSNGVTFNTEAAVRFGKEVIRYDGKSNTLTLDGRKLDLKPGQTVALDGGGFIEKVGNDIRMVSAKGDEVIVKEQGGYIDIHVTLSAGRGDGEVTGGLGRFDADTDAGNDLVMRDGSQTQDVDKFNSEWVVGASESLFGLADREAGKGAAQARVDQAQAKVAELAEAGEAALRKNPMARTVGDKAAITAYEAAKRELDEARKDLQVFENDRTRVLAMQGVASYEQLHDLLLQAIADRGRYQPRAMALSATAAFDPGALSAVDQDILALFQRIQEQEKELRRRLEEDEASRKSSGQPVPRTTPTRMLGPINPGSNATRVLRPTTGAPQAVQTPAAPPNAFSAPVTEPAASLGGGGGARATFR
ncbi:MAG: hypothetical protein VKP57_02590 [Candidatus Sericytochromatia bacterium]|nr:hypothetical protein [Candidatus Sericytochromatia bacterium]